jgi:tRNA1Val (adenine37-N6)-methyltransferase
VTYDALLRGRVRLIQPARGFRSSLDPVLLAGFVRPPYGRFVDIGCGAGPLSFLLLDQDPLASGIGVEIQPRLARLAERGARANGYGARFVVHTGDARACAGAGIGGGYDLVVTNPPFRRVGTGVLSPSSERSLANYEVALRLADWLDAAAALLAPHGRLAAVFPATRWEELQAGLCARQLHPVRARLVVSRAGEAARRLLVEAHRAAAPLALAWDPPLVVHGTGGFSPEMSAMLGEPAE